MSVSACSDFSCKNRTVCSRTWGQDMSWIEFCACGCASILGLARVQQDLQCSTSTMTRTNRSVFKSAGACMHQRAPLHCHAIHLLCVYRAYHSEQGTLQLSKAAHSYWQFLA
jgi:hypothetical protein